VLHNPELELNTAWKRRRGASLPFSSRGSVVSNPEASSLAGGRMVTLPLDEQVHSAPLNKREKGARTKQDWGLSVRDSGNVLSVRANLRSLPSLFVKKNPLLYP